MTVKKKILEKDGEKKNIWHRYFIIRPVKKQKFMCYYGYYHFKQEAIKKSDILLKTVLLTTFF